MSTGWSNNYQQTLAKEWSQVRRSGYVGERVVEQDLGGHARFLVS